MVSLGNLKSELKSRVRGQLVRLGAVSASNDAANTITGQPQSNPGYCHCCRRSTVFVAQRAWLRDHYTCGTCHSVPRHRHMSYVLDTVFPGWEHKRIHEASPTSTFVARYASNYTSSPDDLEQLHFEDNAFDLFITLDVLERVFQPDRAIREILRVLKPGGAHIFTTARHSNIQKSVRREVYEEGDARPMVTWDYGMDFEALLTQWSGAPVTTYITRDRGLGLDGAHPELFVVRKV